MISYSSLSSQAHLIGSWGPNPHPRLRARAASLREYQRLYPSGLSIHFAHVFGMASWGRSTVPEYGNTTKSAIFRANNPTTGEARRGEARRGEARRGLPSARHFNPTP